MKRQTNNSPNDDRCIYPGQRMPGTRRVRRSDPERWPRSDQSDTIPNGAEHTEAVGGEQERASADRASLAADQRRIVTSE
jgi:hypothetical protein